MTPIPSLTTKIGAFLHCGAAVVHNLFGKRRYALPSVGRAITTVYCNSSNYVHPTGHVGEDAVELFACPKNSLAKNLK